MIARSPMTSDPPRRGQRLQPQRPLGHRRLGGPLTTAAGKTVELACYRIPTGERALHGGGRPRRDPYRDFSLLMLLKGRVHEPSDHFVPTNSYT